jgi:NhaA family Na+:H+ antiporter
MSVFIAMLAFDDPQTLAVSKLAVLIGSVAAGLLGIGWGLVGVLPSPEAEDISHRTSTLDQGRRKAEPRP